MRHCYDRLATTGSYRSFPILQLCPGLTANEIQIPHDKHNKVSLLVKSHQNTHNSIKFEVISKYQITLSNTEVLTKQYMRSVLDMSAVL